jgi:hypothetical protein
MSAGDLTQHMVRYGGLSGVAHALVLPCLAEPKVQAKKRFRLVNRQVLQGPVCNNQMACVHGSQMVLLKAGIPMVTSSSAGETMTGTTLRLA